MAQPLSAEAAKKLKELFTATAEFYGSAVGDSYTATPTAAQTIYDKIILDGNPFLQSINFYPVSQMTGEKIGMDVSALPGSRTNTNSNDRTPLDLSSLSTKTYTCHFTEFDTLLKWSTIDAWSKFPDFFQRYIRHVRKARGNAILTTGWYGTSAATATDRNANPNLEDLNVGWLKQLKDFNGGSQYLAGTSQDPIFLGSEDFRNLDVLVHEAKQLLPQQFRESPDNVALIGSGILSRQEATYYEQTSGTPTEKAVTSGMITRAYANLPSITPAFFPPNAILITPLANLSVYYLDSGERREQFNNLKRSRVEEYASSNLAYVVENEEASAYIANVTYE